MNKNNKIESTETTIHKGLSFFKWIQEFSKKIVTITFIIFVIINLFSLGLILYNYLNTSDLMYLDTLINEAHTTFREVIGGYIIKAATENAIKITGSIVEKYLESKYNSGDNEAEEYEESYDDEPGVN